MTAPTVSFAEFFARLEPAFFGYVASNSSIREFVAVHEAFTSSSVFKEVWHSRIKLVLRDTWLVIEDKEALRWVLDRRMTNLRGWDLKLPGCEQGGGSFTQLCLDREWRLVRATLRMTEVGVSVAGGKDHATPLHAASEAGELDVCKLLCERGADKEARDDHNSTPLHHAVANDHLDTVKYLVGRGADKEARNNENWTPLHVAASNDRLDTVKYLVEQGVDKEARDDQNNTPLHLAAYNGDRKSVV